MNLLEGGKKYWSKNIEVSNKTNISTVISYWFIATYFLCWPEYRNIYTASLTPLVHNKSKQHKYTYNRNYIMCNL
jgi:hypothetical protein